MLKISKSGVSLRAVQGIIAYRAPVGAKQILVIINYVFSCPEQLKR